MIEQNTTIPTTEEDLDSSPSKETMDEFRAKLIAAVEGGNRHSETIDLEKLKARVEELQKNPPTPDSKPTTWINEKAGYVMHGNVATFIHSKSQYSVDSNGTFRRISKRRHEK